MHTCNADGAAHAWSRDALLQTCHMSCHGLVDLRIPISMMVISSMTMWTNGCTTLHPPVHCWCTWWCMVCIAYTHPSMQCIHAMRMVQHWYDGLPTTPDMSYVMSWFGVPSTYSISMMVISSMDECGPCGISTLHHRVRVCMHSLHPCGVVCNTYALHARHTVAVRMSLYMHTRCRIPGIHIRYIHGDMIHTPDGICLYSISACARDR